MEITTKAMLERYGDITRRHEKERALYNLLKGNETHIEGLIEQDPTGHWFHKAHRQCDVCENGYIDAAIWILLSEATLFWKMLENWDKEEELS